MNKTENGWAWLGHLTLALLLALSLLVIPLAVPLLGPTPALAGTITSAGSGNWNVTTTWVGGVVPGTTDAVIIASGHNVIVPAGPPIYSPTCAGLTVTGTLTIRDGPIITVNGPVSGAGTITGPGSGGCNFVVSGDWSFSGTLPTGGSSNFISINVIGPSTLSGTVRFRNIEVDSGTVDLTVAATVYKAFSVIGSSTFNPNGNLVSIGGASSGVVFNIRNTATVIVNAATFAGNYAREPDAIDAGSTVNYNRAGTQTVAGLSPTYGNLILSGSGAKTLSTGTTTISGSLTLSGTATSTTVVGLAITGNLNVGSGTTFTVPGYSITVTGTTTVGGTLTISSTSGTKTFTGDVTINNGGIWNETAGEDISFGGDLQNDGTLTAGTGIHNFTGTTKTFSGANPISIPSVTVSGTYTNNGILTVSAALAGTGGLTQGTSATLNIGGTSGITTLTATATGNTVNYTGAGQTVKATTYHHLTLSGSGAKTMTSVSTINGNFNLSGTATATALTGMTIGGSVTIGSGTTFNGGTSLIHNVGGDWTNNGTFTAGTSTINLNGIGAQTMSGATTFYNLILNNINGLTINYDETVSNMLTLTNGKITTGSNKVIISSTSGAVTRTNGYVIGNLQKNVATGTNVLRTFEVGTASGYNPVAVTFASVTTAGNLIANATSGDHPSIGSSTIDATKSVNVYWSLTNSGIGFTSYGAIFNFNNPGDNDTGTNTTNFIVGRYSGGWTYPTVGIKTTTSTQATGMTSFGDFAVGEAVVAPTVTTGGATVIADTSATCGGNITATGGANAISRGINYGTTTGYGSSRTETGSFGTGAFTENLTVLSPGTLYHYQAFAANSAGTGNGSDATFLTLPDAPTSFSVTAQTSTSINLSWTTGTGADTTIVRYNTSGYPTSHTDGNLGYSGSGTNCTISSLLPGTLYYFAAWSSKTAGGYTQYSSSSAQVSQATVAAIEITAPTNITGWSLSPQGTQPKNQTGTLNVTCTGNWTVTVKDADTATGGKMTDYYNSSYGIIQLNNYLIVAAQTYEVTLPTEGTIAKGTGNANVTVTFKQEVLWSDQVLPEGHSYRIIVTFTGTPEL
jgi:hypothetical protein